MKKARCPVRSRTNADDDEAKLRVRPPLGDETVKAGRNVLGPRVRRRFEEERDAANRYH